MPEHDCISLEEEPRASVNVWVATCRCGVRIVRPSKELAQSGHEFHHNAETTGKPGVAMARAALEGEKQ